MLSVVSSHPKDRTCHSPPSPIFNCERSLKNNALLDQQGIVGFKKVLLLLFLLKIKDALPMLGEKRPHIGAHKDGHRRTEVPLPRVVVSDNMIVGKFCLGIGHSGRIEI